MNDHQETRDLLSEDERRWLEASDELEAEQLAAQIRAIESESEGLQKVWGRDVMPSEQGGLPPDLADILFGEES